MASWSVLFLSISMISNVKSSENCRTLYPVDIRLCDLEGNWYYVFSTQPTGEQDCSGFFGKMFSYTHGSYTTTGRPGGSPTLQAQVVNRNVILYPSNPQCKQYFTYKVALVERNHVCFYVCGLKDLYDYVQCFSRNPLQTEAERHRIYNGLRFFGLVLANSDLKMVNRDGCKERSKTNPSRDNQLIRANA